MPRLPDRTCWSADDKCEMAEVHVGYEVEELTRFAVSRNVWPFALAWDDDAVCKVLGVSEPPPQCRGRLDFETAWWLARSLLEAALVHARNVAEFLTRAGPDQDTVYGALYVKPWPPDDLTFTEVEELHRRVAHISASRLVEFDWTDWLFDQLPALYADMRRFLDALPADRRKWFARAEGAVKHYQSLTPA